MKESTKRWILIGSFTLVLALLAVLVPLLFTDERPKAALKEPITVITPEPEIGEDAIAAIMSDLFRSVSPTLLLTAISPQLKR